MTLPAALRAFRQKARHDVCAMPRYDCRYYIWGEGPPLLFIHGLGDIAASFIPLISSLVDDFCCVAYELPRGSGDRARLHKYNHDDLVGDLFTLLDHLKLKQSYIYATSFGSTIALAAARAQPMRLARLVLQGGFAHRSLAPAERIVASLARHLGGPMARLPFRKSFLHQQEAVQFASRPHEYWDFFVQNTGATQIAAMAQRVLLLERLDLRPVLMQIKQPTLLLCGDLDSVVDSSCAETLLAGLPVARRVELAQCGHYAHLTHFEIIAVLVRQFLTPASSGR
jgi:pimeloyl-ACP methyl ester carboxylesterase